MTFSRFFKNVFLHKFFLIFIFYPFIYYTKKNPTRQDGIKKNIDKIFSYIIMYIYVYYKTT
ncbi:MAG: hypothetical protein A2233_02800 [Candidatus Kerfeldbacteria bacterium RIFOXYA2_FULL_38_24]|nr:MAG: hypothetical protein A2233_02800 [Candidatus Kerfeldbacteria bacterium RIFOXYA2_FULL_38_24]